MEKKSKIFSPKPSPPEERPLAAFQAEASGTANQPLSSLAEARQYEDGILILQGDDGGQIYVVARAIGVKCSMETIEQLLMDLDAIAWPENDASMRHIYYERRSIGTGIAGGMGGGIVSERPWIHDQFSQEAPAILAVLAGPRSHGMKSARDRIERHRGLAFESILSLC
jgi:hypothetical protein